MMTVALAVATMVTLGLTLTATAVKTKVRNRLRSLRSRHRDDEEARGPLWELIAAAIVVGALTGLVAVAFRLALEAMDHGRHHILTWAGEQPWLRGALVIGGAALMTSLAAWLTHRVEPYTEGSGIPRVEAVVQGRSAPGSPMILPIKFLGGVLSMGAGLALGREGPSVHMGGNIAITISRLAHRSRSDLRILVAAGAAAGLATTFNAPIAGGVFVLEELLRRFDDRTTLAVLTSCASGFSVSTLFIHGPEFDMPLVDSPSLEHFPSYLLVGLVTGLVAVGYNWALLRGLALADASKWPVELRAALIGALIGLVGLFAPSLVGGGENLTRLALTGGLGVTLVLIVLVVRFLLGVVSYAALTPGGLFAPSLAIGSSLGLLIGLLGQEYFPQVCDSPEALALTAMASFFAASVRAPITGIVLASEMTATVALLPPMLGACAISVMVATLAKSEPIYDALATRSARNVKANRKLRVESPESK